MSIATFTIDGREYVIVPKDEYRPSAPARGAAAGIKRPRGHTKSVRQLGDQMSRQWGDVVAKAKANTRRLTGKEHL
ncbi:MAG: hypothetical protein ACHRHE_06005 [Tepidisphaerales bacterium]